VEEYADLELLLFIDARVPRIPVNDLRARPARSPWLPSATCSRSACGRWPAERPREGHHRPAEISSFEPGDVLVLNGPSWTPLFVVASAVVVGVGAPNSHAMIVSRELGIPCGP
jgi:hypothetical protein